MGGEHELRPGVMAGRFRHEYGSGPLHLVAVVASFSLAGWALVQIFHTPNATNVAIWLFGAAIAHDLVLLPLYSLLASIAYRGLAGGRRDPLRISALNHLRVPAVLAGTLFLVWFPEILGLADPRFLHDTGRTTEPYLGRWLALTAAMFVLSAVAFAVRVRRARRR
jgi:hypothetical protein